MKTEPETWTIKELLQDHDQAILKPNPEYQRGAVWRLPQQQMLIDSLLRGFHLPIFYFHRIDETTRHGSNTRFEIIDGQQRVNAIARFRRGGFALLDPQAPRSRFPRHLRGTNCRWAQLSYDRLDPELQERFLNSPLSIAVISEADTNEARDLFVRLQSGSDLKPQERRDALPGEIGAAVAELAGRLENPGLHFRRCQARARSPVAAVHPRQPFAQKATSPAGHEAAGTVEALTHLAPAQAFRQQQDHARPPRVLSPDGPRPRPPFKRLLLRLRQNDCIRHEPKHTSLQRAGTVH
ncbi:MAG: DUF262 domain-containing protein [Acidobacteria bacterium]|nr:DUF262 domain-containing protein [Acidobacteriota bacterium]